MAIAILVVYGLLLGFLLLFSLGQLQLALAYLKNKGREPLRPRDVPDPIPVVTVQLPVYNERHVITRMIDSVCSMDWPHDRFQVQVLDDSTDETTALAQEGARVWQQRGVDIDVIRRPDRSGFKAGALAHGLAEAKGEFILILDSDFLPASDLLRRTVPWFSDERLGMVQTRWGHLNRNSNLLTRLQAFGLDAHFSVEQTGRSALGHYINFNGTAGVWRKQAIVDAGGWRPDSLTEDLDLSYRAQLKGWRFEFLEEVESPAELPVRMNALKAQQRRWNKGAAECVRLNLGKVWRAKDLRLATKLHATLHLMNSTVFLFILVLAALSVPLLWVKHAHPELNIVFNVAMLFTLSLIVLLLFYSIAQRARKEIGILEFLWTFPVFLSMSMGLSLHNAIAVVEGYLGVRSDFVRTPKLGLVGRENERKKDGYLSSALGPLSILEGLLFLYFLWALWLGWKLNDGGLWLFHGMLALGFGLVFFFSVVHAIRTER